MDGGERVRVVVAQRLARGAHVLLVQRHGGLHVAEALVDQGELRDGEQRVGVLVAEDDPPPGQRLERQRQRRLEVLLDAVHVRNHADGVESLLGHVADGEAVDVQGLLGQRQRQVGVAHVRVPGHRALRS